MHAVIEAWVHAQWAKRGALPCALLPLSWIYRAVAGYKKRHTVPVRLPVPVIVVGNIYVGGTGKTPITIELVKALRGAGYTPGVISRGYRRKGEAPELLDENTPPELAGDEPLLIREKTHCPVAVGRDRVAAGRLLLKEHPEVNVIVSDDGLQHTRLARDIELAVVGARGLGNQWTLPAGPLRESPARLDTVDAIILNATTDTIASRTPRFAATSQLGAVTHLATGKTLDIDELAADIRAQKKTALSAAGIAAPDRFFAMLRAHDITGPVLGLGDHYDYEDNPFAQWQVDYIFITGKDAVKCRRHKDLAADTRLWVADLEMHLDPFLVESVLHRLSQIREKTASAA